MAVGLYLVLPLEAVETGLWVLDGKFLHDGWKLAGRYHSDAALQVHRHSVVDKFVLSLQKENGFQVGGVRGERCVQAPCAALQVTVADNVIA